MKQNANKILVPREFKKYFWDIDFDELDFDKQKNFILGRLLNFGSFETFKWIFKTYKNIEVKNLINIKGRYSLSRNSYLFWLKIVQEKELWQNN